MKNNVLILLPAYNVQNSIRRIVKSIEASEERFLVIDDGSTDGTGKLLEELKAPVLSMKHNSGISNAIVQGMRFAINNSYDNVIIMDADGQHDPNDIKRFVDALRSSEFVFGNRFQVIEGVPSCKVSSNSFASVLYEFCTGRVIPDVSCGFKGMRLTDNLVNYLETASDYEIIYRICNYAVMKQKAISYVDIKAEYLPNSLLYTRRVEMDSLLNALILMKSGKTNETKKMLFELTEHVLHKADFEIQIDNISFFAFYIREYDGYIFQASMAEISDWRIKNGL